MRTSEFFELKHLVHFDWMLKRIKLCACDGKSRFDSRTRALSSVRHSGLVPYKCNFCGCWHLGAGK